MAKPIDTERRLVAIFAADVEGYSRLMGADEVGTMRDLIQRRAILDGLIASHRGRIANTAGDSVLAEFGSAVDAVRCAVEAQKALTQANAGVSPDRQINFRIGIHVGDVMVKGGDLFGDGVNIAARLQTLASAGGTCISGVAHDQVRKILPFAFADLGAQQVKNIEEPVRAFAVSARGASAERTSASPAPADNNRPLPLPDKPSIAVLPFQNMSGDPEQEYFADGIAEDIITALSRISSFFVIARNSTFTYKGRAVDVRQVGRELGVRYVMEGSVRKSGNRLRITGQLIDTASGSHIWAERYDGALEDVFDLQDRITSSVVGAVEPKVHWAEIKRAQDKPTTDLTAYDYYLRAYSKFEQLTEQSVSEALCLLEIAIARDANYSSAYGLVSLCYQTRKSQNWGSIAEAEELGLRAAKQAVGTGKDDPFAYAQAANALSILGLKSRESLSYVERALELNPNSFTAWSIGGWCHCYVGDLQKSIDYFERAMRLAPGNPLLYRSYTGIGYAHFFNDDYETAIAWADKAIRDHPTWISGLRLKLLALALGGRLNEAKETFGHLLALAPHTSISTLKGLPFEQKAMRDKLETAGRRASLPE